ncbi:hypothetical protein LTS18_010783, partial [Coniosporium uncinatum]
QIAFDSASGSISMRSRDSGPSRSLQETRGEKVWNIVWKISQKSSMGIGSSKNCHSANAQLLKTAKKRKTPSL